MNSINPFVAFLKSQSHLSFCSLIVQLQTGFDQVFSVSAFRVHFKTICFFFFPYCIIELKNYTSGANGVDRSAYSFMAETKRWIKGMSALMDSADFNP